MEGKKYTSSRVFDLKVYDDEGAFITNVDYASESNMHIDEDGSGFLEISSCIFDEKLIKFRNGQLSKNTNDYDSELFSIIKKPIGIKSQKGNKVNCKIICKTKIETPIGELSDMIIEIPKATIAAGADFFQSIRDIGKFDTLFKINPDKDGNLYFIHGI